MSNLDTLQREYRMLKYINSLPRKIVKLHGNANLTEFVLHDLCHENCFNLTKAAYFIDNPDFNCTQGVAGFSRQESFNNAEMIWDRPEAFSAHMQTSAFNKKVRTVSHRSVKHVDEGDRQLAKDLAQDLGFTNHGYASWGLKHDNHGFLVYERANVDDAFGHDHMLDALSLLSFCPIF